MIMSKQSKTTKELNKSKKLEKYFDEWGSRCYLYSANQIEHKLTIRENMFKGF